MVAKDKKEKQLYTLLRKLSDSVQGRDDLGIIIACSIVNRIIRLDNRKGFAEEEKFEAVKSVYAGLEEATELCLQKGEFAALCELLEGVNLMRVNLPDGRSKSTLLSAVADDLVQKNYQETLRRRGLNLYDLVMQTLPLKGKRNILLADYEMVKTNFAYKR